MADDNTSSNAGRHTGRTIGRYTVLEPLGKGGMGESGAIRIFGAGDFRKWLEIPAQSLKPSTRVPLSAQRRPCAGRPDYFQSSLSTPGEQYIDGTDVSQSKDSNRMVHLRRASGTEKFWLIWAAQPVSELERVSANPTIQDANHIAALREFLTRHVESKFEVEKDKIKKQATAKGQGEILAALVELEHH